MTYLGTSLDPDEYYRAHSGSYSNPHEDAVTGLTHALFGHVSGTVLDMGCGPGLATTRLVRLGHVGPYVGIDQAPTMAERYFSETSYPALVQDFWDPLPAASTAVFAHSLHLCPPSRLHLVRYALRQAGVSRILVISPLKRAISALSLPILQSVTARSGVSRKTIFGAALELVI